MLLHLGGDEMVSLRDIISIMDFKISQMSKTTQEFLNIAQEEGFIKKISKEECKSFVLAEVNNKTIVYFSPISSITLFKRMDFINNMGKVDKGTEGVNYGSSK